MPTYTFRYKNNKKKKEFTDFMSISAMEQYLIDNQDIELCPAAPFVGDSIRQGLVKPSEGFRDHLRRIKKFHPRSTINTF